MGEITDAEAKQLLDLEGVKQQGVARKEILFDVGIFVDVDDDDDDDDDEDETLGNRNVSESLPPKLPMHDAQVTAHAARRRFAAVEANEAMFQITIGLIHPWCCRWEVIGLS